MFRKKAGQAQSHFVREIYTRRVCRLRRRSAISLRAGDILVLSNGEYVIVEQIQHELLESPIKVYNFEVEDYHTYYVSANADSDEFVLVHSRCGYKPLRQNDYKAVINPGMFRCQ